MWGDVAALSTRRRAEDRFEFESDVNGRMFGAKGLCYTAAFRLSLGSVDASPGMMYWSRHAAVLIESVARSEHRHTA